MPTPGIIQVKINGNGPKEVHTLSNDAKILASFNKANAANILAQAAFDFANGSSGGASFTTANAAFDKANASFSTGNSSYTKANSANVLAQAAFDKANLSDPLLATAAFTKANSANILAQAAFDQANTSNISSVFTQANASFNTGNAAFIQANSANILAQAGFDQANSANILGQSAFNLGNSVNALANAAFSKANAAAISAQFAFTQANSAASSALIGINQSTFALTTANSAANNFMLNVLNFGAKGDLTTVTDAVFTANSNVVTSATAKFVAGDVDKYVEIPGANTQANGLPLMTTITQVINATTIMISTNTVYSSGNSYLTYIPGFLGSGGNVGDYSIGETFTVNGGVSSYPAIGQITALRARSPNNDTTVIVVNPGDGGTNGNLLLTGTTGTGQRVTLRGVIANNKLVSATLLGTSGYTVAPNNTNDPIASATTLGEVRTAPVGASVAYNLGIRLARIANTGSYSVLPTNPVSTGNGSISGANGAIFNAQWFTSTVMLFGTDDTPAFSNAWNLAVSTMLQTGRWSRSIVKIPARNYLIAGNQLPTITNPVFFSGDGMGQTQVYISPNYTGNTIFAYNELFGDDAPIGVTQTNIGRPDFGSGVERMSFFGNISGNTFVDVIRLYGRNSGFLFRDIFAAHTGVVIASGINPPAITRGYWVESYVENIRTMDAGRPGFGTIDINSVGKSGRSNELSLVGLNIINPIGHGIRVACDGADDDSPNKDAKNIRFFDVRVEQMLSPRFLGHDLIRFGDLGNQSGVEMIHMYRVWLVNPSIGGAAVNFIGLEDNLIPTDIHLRGLRISGGAPAGNGIQINAGARLSFEIDVIGSWGPDISISPYNTNTRVANTGANSTNSVVQLDPLASSVSNIYVGNPLVINSESRMIISYDGNTKLATVSGHQGTPNTFSSAPTANTPYSIDQLIDTFIRFDQYGVANTYTYSIPDSNVGNILYSPVYSKGLLGSGNSKFLTDDFIFTGNTFSRQGNSAFGQANAAFNLANNNNAIIQLAFTNSNAAFTQANVANILAQSGFNFANSVNILSQAAFANANAGLLQANAAFNLSNTANILAQASFDFGNTVNALAQSSFTKANSANVLAQASFDFANSSNTLAQSAYNKANSANILAQVGFSQTNIAFTQANASFNTGNSAFIQANAAYANANAGFAQANFSYSQANAAFANANASFVQANAAFNLSNNANILAQAAFNQANTANTKAYSNVISVLNWGWDQNTNVSNGQTPGFYMPWPGSITSLKTKIGQSNTGNIVIQVKINSTNITGLNLVFANSNTEQTFTPTSGNTFAIGDYVYMTYNIANTQQVAVGSMFNLLLSHS